MIIDTDSLALGFYSVSLFRKVERASNLLNLKDLPYLYRWAGAINRVGATLLSAFFEAFSIDSVRATLFLYFSGASPRLCL